MKIDYLTSIVITLLSFTCGLKAQTTTIDSTLRENRPVVRHQETSPLPDKIHVVGYLDDYPAMGMCGMYCIGGTIKVKLKKMIPGYNSEYAYLVTACLSDKATKGTLVNVVASKLKIKEKACYYTSVMNVFDSGGVAFYKLSEIETAKVK